MSNNLNTFEERMAGYMAYHRDPRNRFTHFFGVPMVFYSPLIALGWARTEIAGVEVTLAAIVCTLVMLWYIKLDWSLGLIMSLLSIPAYYYCDLASKLPFNESLTIFLAITVIGWAIQFVGHYFEGRRPALADNLVQSLMGPLFVVIEVIFALGFRKDLEANVNAKVSNYVPSK
ncbi:MAG: Mpo1-like protein [Leptospiraceae bacterium]|nr:Mpo1-like protein [Leptospiraceae bacterium]